MDRNSPGTDIKWVSLPDWGTGNLPAGGWKPDRKPAFKISGAWRDVLLLGDYNPVSEGNPRDIKEDWDSDNRNPPYGADKNRCRVLAQIR